MARPVKRIQADAESVKELQCRARPGGPQPLERAPRRHVPRHSAAHLGEEQVEAALERSPIRGEVLGRAISKPISPCAMPIRTPLNARWKMPRSLRKSSVPAHLRVGTRVACEARQVCY